MKQQFLAFGVKSITPAVPHRNVCADLKTPGVPSRNLAGKKHVFNVRQMKSALCHGCRAAPRSPVLGSPGSASASAAASRKLRCEIVLFI